jgi:uncharacterized repeat protein (TIGR01451 family)
MANARVRGKHVWTMAALSLVLVAALVAALAFGGRAANAAGAGADLHINKTVKPKTVQVSQKQTFHIHVRNESRRNATSVKMTDPLPGQVKFIRASTSLHRPGSCGSIRRTVECNLGTLRGGERVKIEILVKAVKAGSYTNRAFVSQKSSELDASDNFDTATASATRS